MKQIKDAGCAPFLFSDVLKALHYDGIKGSIEANSIEVICPVCGGNRCYVNNAKGIWHCFKCDASGGEKKFVEALGVDWKNIVNSISGSFDALYDKRIALYNPSIEAETAKTKAHKDLVYREMMKLLRLRKNHYISLLERGLTKEEIKKLGYKSYPKSNKEKAFIVKKLQEKNLELEGIPGFYFNTSANQWFMRDLPSCFCIPVISYDGLMLGIQLRYDNADKGPRYNWLSTNPETYINNKQRFPRGTKAIIHPHCANHGNKSPDVVYITEGPLKADIASLLSGRTFIAIPGVNSYQHLKETLLYMSENYGKKLCVNAFDMDQYQNKNVQRGVKNVQKIVTQVMPWKSITWDGFKGIDDYLVGRRNYRFAVQRSQNEKLNK